MSLYNLFKSATTAAVSTTASVAGYALAPSVVYPVVRSGFDCVYGPTSGVVSTVGREWSIYILGSTLLPYAPGVGLAVGGIAGRVAASATFYVAEQAVTAGVNCYKRSCNNRIANSFHNKFVEEGELAGEDSWVSVVSKQEQAQDVLAF